MKKFTVQSTIKLSKFLKKEYGAEMPYSAYQKLLRNKDIKINGKRVNCDAMLNPNDVLEVYFDGTNKPLLVVYADENLLVLDKPSGITSEDYEFLVKKTYRSAKLCHRLDRNTSGLIIFSLNSEAEEELLKAFKNRTVNKYYLTEVYGLFDSNFGRFEDYLVKDENLSKVKIFSRQFDGGVKIITEYKVVETLENSSIIEVNLITGKTHQIRAHFAFYGHFVIGDGKYGDNMINKRFKAKYQRLTAYRLIFEFDEGKLNYLNGKEIKLNRKPF